MIGNAIAGRATGAGVIAFARVLTGVRGNWQGCLPEARPRIYFANHASHGDFVLIWSVLPRAIRARTRPVAGADYWLRGRTRRFLAEKVFRAVLVDRRPEARSDDPIAAMAAPLAAGESLILFPEGTRNTSDVPLLPFRSGLARLAEAVPSAELVPVWIDNLNRVMPKGMPVPIPLLCTVTFGAPVAPHAGEARPAFLARAREALLALAPRRETP
ncbi:MAG: lysophospholipid acyltransferase family protein [Alphaproteobacteria bacterium]